MQWKSFTTCISSFSVESERSRSFFSNLFHVQFLYITYICIYVGRQIDITVSYFHILSTQKITYHKIIEKKNEKKLEKNAKK